MSDIELEDEVPEVAVNKNDQKRIFVNHVDTYNGKNIGRVKTTGQIFKRNIFFIFSILANQFLSKCKVGASQEGSEEEAGNEEETLELGGDNKPANTYKVYGTLKKPEESKKPDFLKEVVKVSYYNKNLSFYQKEIFKSNKQTHGNRTRTKTVFWST